MNLKIAQSLRWCLLLLTIHSSPSSANPPTLSPPQVTGDGLFGQYYNYSSAPYYDNNFPTGGSLTLSRIDPTINFNWSTISPAPSIQQALFGTVWTGYLYVPLSGIYSFQTVSDDGIQLWLDMDGQGFANPNNQLIVDWPPHASTTDGMWPVFLNQGYYPITMYYYQNYGGAVAQLSWQYYDANWWEYIFGYPDPNAFPMTIIPQNELFSGQSLTLNGAAQSCGVLNQIELDFSEPVNPSTISNTQNYTILGGTNPVVTNAQLNPVNSSSVLLSTSPALIPGTTYQISVQNVADTAGYGIAAGSSTSLTPQNGTQLVPGLLGRYFDQNGQAYAFFSGKEVDRVDSTINFPALSGTWPVAGIPNTNFSTEWDGYLVPSKSGTYTLSLSSDDGSSMQLAGNTIINQWLLQSATTVSSQSITLKKNQYYPVHIQYFQGPGQSVMQMYWQSNHFSTQIIPAANLYYCAANSVAGFTLVSSTSASTCTPDSVQIIAVDASGHPVNTYTGTIAISTSSGHGSWSLATGQGAFSAGASDSGQATYTYVSADQGSVTLNLMNTHADNLQIQATGSGISGSSALISFRDNEFIISSIDPIGNDVVAGRPHHLQAQLWTRNPTNGNQCALASTYNGNFGLKAWLTRGSSDPAGLAPSINSVSLPNTAPGSNNLSLTFNAGTAAFYLNTGDVGQWLINLEDNTSGFAQSVGGSANSILGTSPSYVIRPFGFALDFNNDRKTNGLNDAALSYADNANDYPWFAKAANPFSMTVQAVLWNSAQDQNNDGQPDTGSNLLGDALTPHFNTPVTLAAVQVLPNPGNVGQLSPTTATNFIGGQSTMNASYSEVGIINIQAQLTNYLGGINTIFGIAPYVGRFVPDHLSLVPGSAVLTPACGINPNGFSYMAQPMNMQWQLVAQNLNNATTTNYTGSFAKLALNGAQAAGMSFRAANMGSSTTPLSSRLQLGALSGNSWNNGQSTMLLSTLALTPLSQPDGAYDNFTIGIAATDTDGIAMTGFNFASTGGTNDAVLLGTTRERYGRLWLNNVNGSELIPLVMPVLAQYYLNLGNGSGGFVSNTLDNCTSIPLTPVLSSSQYGVLQLSNPQGAISTASTTPSYVSPNTSVLSSGQTNITLSAPGSTGSLEVALPGVPAWLQLYPYNWLIPGLGTTTPAASATFGVYPGRAPVIYWHEQFR